MKLIIVESPGKLKSLKKILGADWEVAASFGHFRDLPSDEMGVEPPSFRPKYVFNDKGKSVIAKIKSLSSKADSVYIASDQDREGEAIAWHLKESLGLKDYHRVTFGEITKNAILSAIASPRKIDINLVAAQEARRVLDRLVGYSVSPAVSVRLNQQGLSAGRVQSPATALVVDRENEIASFKPTNHFGVRATFEGPWTADWVFKKMLPEGQEYWLDEVFAKKVSDLRDFSVFSYKEGEMKRAPPPPFTTSTLQQAASVSLGFNPKKTMSLAQALYEQGHITYMRTDNPNLSKDALNAIADYAKDKGLPLAPSFRTWTAKAGAQEAHEAVRPSYFTAETAGETPDEHKLYELIRNRALASQLADAVYATRRVILKADNAIDGTDIYFEGKGKTMTSPGWTSLTAEDQATEASEDQEPDNPIPNLTEGSKVLAIKGELQSKVTKPPPRYTEASLVKELENKGIGRPATFASIISNIVDKAYVAVDKKQKLSATPLGINVVKDLSETFSFIKYDFTKSMEDRLDDVANGKVKYLQVVTELYDKLQTELTSYIKKPPPAAAGPVHLCKASGHPLRRIKGKSGYFWGCSGHPTCSKTYPDNKGEPLFEEASAHKCPSCGSGLARKKGSSGFFWGCSKYPECKVTLPDAKGSPDFSKYREVDPNAAPKPAPVKSEHKCKKCGSALIHRVKEGSYNFWGCSGYPKCKETYKDLEGKPNFG